ncbi:MAG: DUF359 domain-containing protein [Candidatus Heimdallarchaeota archaeon]|nr:DUF359 domain-containing protein [Candidatus Heimdallarchaeota archaeon]MBY8993289.1 DUF359 domain-containing protein [Candidatus Heimdallarchaeota archaeon]
MKDNSKDSFKEYLLPEEMRSELKEPLGELITGEPTQKLLEIIQEEHPPLIIFVGDFCVEDALKHGLVPDISIIDGKNLREQYHEISIHNAKVINSNNPPAKITVESWTKIKEAIIRQIQRKEKKLPKEPIVLLITGEEDLLVFPAVLEAPENSFVVYGQPHEGIVLIKVTLNAKFKLEKLIERMKVE